MLIVRSFFFCNTIARKPRFESGGISQEGILFKGSIYLVVTPELMIGVKDKSTVKTVGKQRFFLTSEGG